MVYTSKEQLIKTLKEQLVTNDRQAIKGLLVIYSYQTKDERESQCTKEYNNRGFTAFDSEILSSFAEHYKTKGFLSPKQMNFVKKYMPKYAKQLIECSIACSKIRKEGNEYIFVS